MSKKQVGLGAFGFTKIVCRKDGVIQFSVQQLRGRGGRRPQAASLLAGSSTIPQFFFIVTSSFSYYHHFHRTTETGCNSDFQKPHIRLQLSEKTQS